MAAGAEDPSGLVQVEEPFPEPMLLATTVELLRRAGGPRPAGPGPARGHADPARYDAVHHHFDVLVVGAGPAGLAAALTAARAGARVVLVDEQSEAGGALLPAPTTLDGAPALDWVAAAVAELAGHPDVLHLQRTTAFGCYDDGFVLALERRTDHLGAAGARSTCPASGCGASGPARSSSRPAPTSGRSSSPTTTGPASCSPAPPAPS